MSLCIALNNPSARFSIIAGDGRITSGEDILRDDHKKLTKLTEHASIFCSGAQVYCEELREMVEVQVNEQTSIEELGLIVQKASIEVQQRFEEDYPDYREVMPGFGALATVVAYYDAATDESGTLEFCVSDGFEPHDSRDSVLRVRGVEYEKVMDYFLSHFNPEQSIESVFVSFKYASSLNNNVGGTITLHVISKDGISTYEWRDFG
ncbi:hypothetical protein [Paenibacillus dokdonensis]|uniref:hypothetical protein n=1 Tax=Paenibacillus dokdonensis TaxID=2567944 RepID=UPI0010A916F7|nr:hypothetical protein [Paenibacillus dokdonensis]